MNRRDEVRETLAKGPEARAKLVEQILAVSIPLQIRALREERKWTQSELAERAGLHQSQICELEGFGNGRLPSIATLQKIASACDVGLLVKFTSWPEFFEWAVTWDQQSSPASYWADTALSSEPEGR